MGASTRLSPLRNICTVSPVTKLPVEGTWDVYMAWWPKKQANSSHKRLITIPANLSHIMSYNYPKKNTCPFLHWVWSSRITSRIEIRSSGLNFQHFSKSPHTLTVEEDRASSSEIRKGSLPLRTWSMTWGSWVISGYGCIPDRISFMYYQMCSLSNLSGTTYKSRDRECPHITIHAPVSAIKQLRGHPAPGSCKTRWCGLWKGIAQDPRQAEVGQERVTRIWD